MKSLMKPIRATALFFLFSAPCICLFAGCNRAQQGQPIPPPPEVVTVTVTAQPVVLNTELPGRTSAYLVAEVRPQVSGIIEKRLFIEGSHVKAGEVLYRIDAAPFQAAYDSALASLARAEATLPAIRSRAQRYRESLASKAVSQQDYDDVEAALRQAEAEVKYWKAAVQTARINLGYTRVKAPIAGRIGKSNVTEGALVTAGQPTPLVTIQQFDPIYVDVPQSTAELLRLKRRVEGGKLSQNGMGQKKVQLLLEDGSAYPIDGTLQFRDVTVDRMTGTVILRAVFPNPEDILLPGMFVRAVIREGENPKAILIPQPAVARDPKGNPYVMLVDADGKVQERQIAIDRAMGSQWLIASGLAPGERVIVEGLIKVRPGASVKAISAAAAGTLPAQPAGNAAQPAN